MILVAGERGRRGERSATNFIFNLEVGKGSLGPPIARNRFVLAQEGATNVAVESGTRPAWGVGESPVAQGIAKGGTQRFHPKSGQS